MDDEKSSAPKDPGLHPGTRLPYADRDASNTRPDRRYLPTLFDRLFDDAPSSKSEAADSYTPTRGQMRNIIQRDLTYLLNNTNQSDLIDAKKYPAAIASTINFGVPALVGGYLSEKKWVDIELMIRNAIRFFEPRIIPQTLIVKPLLKPHVSTSYNVLMFEIAGQVQMLPYPMEFSVQSAVDLETNHIELLTKGMK